MQDFSSLSAICSIRASNTETTDVKAPTASGQSPGQSGFCKSKPTRRSFHALHGGTGARILMVAKSFSLSSLIHHIDKNFVVCFLSFCRFLSKKACKMDEFQGAEETSFVVDEVSNIIKESVEGAIGGNAYQHNKVNQWTSNVVEQCLNQLTKLGKPFKYIVTCVIMQKNGAGLHTASSCFWDNTSDGSCTVRWENKTMYCIVSVFGLAI